MKRLCFLVVATFVTGILSPLCAQQYPSPTFSDLTATGKSTAQNSGTLNVVPNGTYRAATAVSAIANSPTLLPQVNGFQAPDKLYLLSDVGNVALYSQNTGNIVDDFHPKPSVSGWTATSATFSTPLTGTQVANVNAMIAMNFAYGNPVGVMALSSDGLLGNITAVSANSISVGNWMAEGHTATGQVPTGGSVQINAQSHIWAQNSVVTLPANTIANNATGIEGDFLNIKGPTGGNANIVGATMNCHDTGFAYGCQTGYIAAGTVSNPWTYGYNSFRNKIGFISQADSQYGYMVDHKTTDPTFGFVSFQKAGHPFGYNPGGTGFAWLVDPSGGMSIGNPSLKNGYSFRVNSAGTNPRIAAACVDTDCNLELRAQGAGTVTIIDGVTVAGATTLNGTSLKVPSAVGGRPTKYVCADASGNWFAQISPCR